MRAPLSGTVPDWLQQCAATAPTHPAVVYGDTSMTYKALNLAVGVAASRLRSAGVRQGETVALLTNNGREFVVAVHAVSRTGAVLLPMNVRLTSAELAWQLEDAGARHLLIDKACRSAGEAAAGGIEQLKVTNLEDLIAPETGARLESAHDFDLQSTHTIVYTSGTTGRPKGAMLTYGNHFWSAMASAINLGLHADDRWLACLPLFHVGGLAIVLRSVIYGTTAIIHESFDPVRVNKAIDEDGVTIVSVVANMLQRMLAERGERPYPASLRCVPLGGGPAPEPLLRQCERLGVPVVQTYGLTEAASQVATLAPHDALRKLGSAGKPLFGTELRIERPDGGAAEPGEPGEIIVRGPTVTPGYLNKLEESEHALRDGWLHTGDVGYLDAEGYLYVLDRRDDLIVSGGENVYPAEVESVLQSHPAVLEAGVVGIDDERWGQAPAAVVVLEQKATLTADELIAFCRERLAAYKAPRRIEFASRLPRNAAGKLLRREMLQTLQ
jgi:o-succinylbenzoate---CoA ligase